MDFADIQKHLSVKTEKNGPRLELILGHAKFVICEPQIFFKWSIGVEDLRGGFGFGVEQTVAGITAEQIARNFERLISDPVGAMLVCAWNDIRLSELILWMDLRGSDEQCRWIFEKLIYAELRYLNRVLNSRDFGHKERYEWHARYVEAMPELEKAAAQRGLDFQEVRNKIAKTIDAAARFV